MVALVLVFAQAVAAFGFPIVQTRYTVKACGCVTPCGASSENCCCAKAVPAPAAVKESKPRCSKCVEREQLAQPVEPQVKWVAAFQAKQCRGESALGLLAELPSVPPPAHETGRDFTTVLTRLTIHDSMLESHVASLLDPPPRSN